MTLPAAPIIVSALFAPAEQAWLDRLRQRYFPPERNVLAAHLTLFHHLPPSVAPELVGRLAEQTRRSPLSAEAAGVMNLGGGTAIRIVAPDLAAIRAELADAFELLLTPQDRAGWRPHVTIQNKVTAEAARALQGELATSLKRRLTVAALAAWYYRGGPWELIKQFKFTQRQY